MCTSKFISQIRVFVQITLTMILLCSSLFAKDGSQTLRIAVGESHDLQLPERARRVDMSDPSLLSVNPSRDKKKLFIQAKKSGKATLLVDLMGDQTLKFQVLIMSIQDLIIEEAEKIEGVSAHKRGELVALSGRVSSRESLGKIRKLKLNYPGKILDTTGRKLQSASTLIKSINETLKDHDLSSMQAQSYGQILVLEGSAKDDMQAELAYRLARTIAPNIENRISQTSQGGPPISLEVLFVEVKNDNDKEFGFSPFQAPGEQTEGASLGQGQINVSRVSKPSGNPYIDWQIGPLTSFLKMIQHKSKARVLSNPTLVARSGVEASFQSGKTIYIVSQSVQNGAVVETLHPIKAGIILRITPQIDALNQIDAKIQAEVSEFVGTSAKIPNKTVSVVETAVTIPEGQTILLSGLKKNGQTKSVDRIPLVASIPLIGEFFKSRSFTDNQSETIVLVTMTRVAPEDYNGTSLGQKLWEGHEDEISFSFVD